VVADANGNLLQDDELAQEILDDFVILAEESESPPEDGASKEPARGEK
jgi:hypothetical protein